MERSQLEVIVVVGALGGLGLFLYEYYGKTSPQKTNTDFQGKGASKKSISAAKALAADVPNLAAGSYVNTQGDKKIVTQTYTADKAAKDENVTVLARPGGIGYASTGVLVTAPKTADPKTVFSEVNGKCLTNWASDPNYADIRARVFSTPVKQQGPLLNQLCLTRGNAAASLVKII